MEISPDIQAKMSMITIDPNGDIVLELSETRLLVSSKVLTLVSPVFEAMFKSHFKEGLRSRKSEEPSTLPLTEDNAEAAILLCTIIHHRSHEIPEKPNTLCLETLAFVCNKYQCTGAIAHHGILWLQKLVRDATQEDLNRLLLFAYVLDLPEPLLNISWEILQLQAGPFVNLPGLTNHPLIHHDLLGVFV